MKLRSKVRNFFFKLLYRRKNFLAASARHYDIRVMIDPKEGIGGMWEEIGSLQFEFLKSQNLQPGQLLLDVGCGTLRGGRHFIRYLDSGNYHGMDISRAAIKAAKRIVETEGLTSKNPKLWVNDEMRLRFSGIADRYDFILAQAVIPNLREEDIEECFANIGRILKDNGIFFFTYEEGRPGTQGDFNYFFYEFGFFSSLASKYGLTITQYPEFLHPRNQKMIGLTRENPGRPSVDQ